MTDAAEKPKAAEINCLKVRDDHQPALFQQAADGKFTLSPGSAASWIEQQESEFTLNDLRRHIEPWLTSLFQSEHLSVLIGSGLTHAVHHIATGKLAPAGMSNDVTNDDYQSAIKSAAKTAAEKAKRGAGNIEDQIRAANELIRGLTILGNKQDADALQTDLTTAMGQLAAAILEGERNLATSAEEQRERAYSALITFLMSFSSRTGTRDRLNIFTTNYDRLIEAGAELAGLHLLDRFVGNLLPIFRSSRLDVDMHYNPPGIRGEPRYLEGVARFTKLHGSIDWVQAAEDIRRIGLPFGAPSADPYLDAPGTEGATAHRLMIYPNAAKDRETAEYPYVELFRDLAAAACRPNHTLVTYGYSFGDEHINRVIRDMLTIPSTHLVIISRDDTLERIKPVYETRKSQVSLLLGPQLADLQTLTEYFLPKASIDRATFRMSELLKQRYGTGPQTAHKDAPAAGAGDGS